MSEMSEDEFVEQYEAVGPVRLIARRFYRERHPKGMHHNGPMCVDVEVRTLEYLLERWRKPAAIRAAGGES